MFTPDVGAARALRFLPRQFQHFLQARCDRQVARRCGLASANERLDSTANLLDINPHGSEESSGETMLGPEQTQQKVLRANVVVVEGAGFVLRSRHRSACVHVEAVERTSTRIERFSTGLVLVPAPTDESVQEIPGRRRTGHLSASIDDLMNPLVAQSERLRGVAHRSAGRMETSDRLVIRQAAPLRLILQSGERITRDQGFVEEHLVEFHVVYLTRQYKSRLIR